MSSTSYLLIFAFFAFLNYHKVEARGYRPNPAFNTEDLGSFINNPASERDILNLILESRGTSIEKIYDRLAGADGNLETIVSDLNSELKGDLAQIDGDIIRLNPDEIKSLLKDGVQATIRKRFGNNPFAASALEENINQQFAFQSDRFNALIKGNTIPVESARKVLETHELNRQKRSLQPRDFDLGGIVSDLVFGMVRDQLTSIVWNVLEGVKNTLIDLRTNMPPNDTLNNVFAYTINTVLNGGIQLITQIQENIRPTNATTEAPVSRKRRQADTDTEVTTASSGDTDANDNTGGGGGGGLSIILEPILNLLALLLSPVRLLLELILNGLVTILRPLLGNILADSISSALNAIIDLLIPSFPV